MSSQAIASETSPLLSPSSRSHSDASHDGQSSDPGEPRASLALKVAAAMYSFATLGLFMSSIGVILPPVSRQYALTDLSVSSIFLVGPVGYVFAAQCNNSIHARFGQRGIAVLGPIFHIVAAATLATCPPFGAVLIAFAVAAVGIGILDGSWCAWVGSMSNANVFSGLLHGSFSVGAAAGPFLASTMMADWHRPWYQWYYFLFGAAVVELVVLLFAFRYESAARYRDEKRTASTHVNIETKSILKHWATWVSAAYFLADVGTETAISGWVISFMIRARHATPRLASLCSSGYWVGMAVGRFALGAVTEMIGVRHANLIYLICIILLQVLFATVRTSPVAIISMTLVGVFMGPLFPSGVVVLAQLLPKELHVAAVSFVASIGQVGGALLPFGIGAAVQGLGIEAFCFAIIVPTIIALAFWMIFGRIPLPSGDLPLEQDDAREESS